MQRLIRGTAPLAVMLLLAACGGGDGGKKETTSVAGPTTSIPTTVPPVAQGGILDAAALSQRCANYASYAGTVGLAMAAAMDPKVAAQLEELKAKMNLDEAPEEIRDDFKVVTDYARGLGEVLARYPMKAGQYDPAAMAALGAYTQSVDQAGMTAASENINKWLQVNCKS
jgi:hypothetical protein